jgi:hypothetical protein
MSLSYRFHPIDVDLPEHWRVLEIEKKHRRAAFGLYVAASCYSRKHKPGMVVRAYVENDDPKLIDELVRVGLWLPRDDGTGWDIFNWEKKSPGRKKSSEPPGASTTRVQKHRESKKTANDVTVETVDETVETESVPHAGTSISVSSSVSSDLSQADQINLTGGSGSVPDWFAVGVVGTVEQAGFTADNIPARWLEYEGSRARKTWSMNHKDAVAWLLAVLRREKRDADAKPKAKGAEATKQPYDENAPWMKLPEVG